MLSAGALRHPLTLQNPAVTADATGGHSTVWADASPATVWGRIETAVGGTEGVVGPAERAPATHLVTIRYHAQVTPRSRLLFGARTLHILGIENIEEKNVVLRLSCQERQ